MSLSVEGGLVTTGGLVVGRAGCAATGRPIAGLTGLTGPGRGGVATVCAGITAPAPAPTGRADVSPFAELAEGVSAATESALAGALFAVVTVAAGVAGAPEGTTTTVGAGGDDPKRVTRAKIPPRQPMMMATSAT